MVTFLHSADWQMGMKASHAGEAGEKVREARLEAAERVVALAREEGVDFLLLAGDTFEDNGVEGVLVQRTADVLARAGRPVYILPGNHDPLVPGSVWEHPAWREERGLFVLKEREPLDLGPALLFPCPLREKYGTSDPTAWIRPGRADKPRLGAAHGSLQALPMEDPVFPVPARAAERSGLDYLALGHWHSTFLHPSPGGGVRTAYSGTHEPTKFGERESGNVLVVEIEGPGAVPSLRKIPTGVLSWKTLDRDIRDRAGLDALVGEIEAWEGPEKTLLRVRLEGLLFPGAESLLDRAEEILEARFLFGRLEAEGLQPSPEDEAWVEALPAGHLREAARALLDRAALPGREGEVARRALLELYSAAGEVRS